MWLGNSIWEVGARLVENEGVGSPPSFFGEGVPFGRVMRHCRSSLISVHPIYKGIRDASR